MSSVWNQAADLIENYKGYVEIFEGGIWYKYDQIVSWTVETIADTVKHYGTRGQKTKTSVGNSSVYALRLKRTADLYDTADPPTAIRAISYWKSKIHGIPPTIPQISLRGVSESNATANKFVVSNFVATVERILESREDQEGAGEVLIAGEILIHTDNKRQSAVP